MTPGEADIRTIAVAPEPSGLWGRVVRLASAPVTSSGDDYTFWSDIAHYHIEGETEIGLCTVFPQPDAIIDGMERHIRTPEILIPIDGAFVVPILDPAAGTPKVIRVAMGEAVILETSVWHGPCHPVDQPRSSYFVVFRRGTPHEDVEKKQVTPFRVSRA